MSTEVQTHIASKDLRCTTCGRVIPQGHRYFTVYDHKYGVTLKTEHTNCELYNKERVILTTSESSE